MRNGDLYKIQRLMQAEGRTLEEIIEAYRNRYSEEEILRFFPPEAPKPKRARKTEAA